MPDDLVTSWTHYRENASHAEKFNKPPAEGAVLHGMKQAVPIHGGPGTHGAGGGGTSGGVVGQGHEEEQPSSSASAGGGAAPELGRSKSAKTRRSSRGNSLGGMDDGPPSFSGPAEGWNEWEQAKMEELLAEVRGHLGASFFSPSRLPPSMSADACAAWPPLNAVVFPTRFLETEDLGNNFVSRRLPPCTRRNARLTSLPPPPSPALTSSSTRTKCSPSLFLIDVDEKSARNRCLCFPPLRTLSPFAPT